MMSRLCLTDESQREGGLLVGREKAILHVALDRLPRSFTLACGARGGILAMPTTVAEVQEAFAHYEKLGYEIERCAASACAEAAK